MVSRYNHDSAAVGAFSEFTRVIVYSHVYMLYLYMIEHRSIIAQAITSIASWAAVMDDGFFGV